MVLLDLASAQYLKQHQVHLVKEARHAGLGKFIAKFELGRSGISLHRTPGHPFQCERVSKFENNHRPSESGADLYAAFLTSLKSS